MKRNNRKPNMGITIFVVVGIIIVVILITYFSHKSNVLYLNYQFDGLIEQVSYDIQHKATIVVKGKKYGLKDPNCDFDHNRIEKGDSISKKSNTMIITLFKRNGEVITEGVDN